MLNHYCCSTRSKSTTQKIKQYGKYAKTLAHSLNGHEWALFSVFLLATFINTITINCMETFYPKEAISRGINRGHIGIVIGTYQLSRFFMAPIIGKYLGKIGTKIAFYTALFVVSGSAICFGFLTFLDNNLTFFWCSLAIRFFQAVGRTFFVLSIFTLSAELFPDHVSLIGSILETFEGVGQISGPIFGASLYELGGFMLPNFVTGTTMALMALAFVWLAPFPMPTTTTTVVTTARKNADDKMAVGTEQHQIKTTATTTIMVQIDEDEFENGQPRQQQHQQQQQQQEKEEAFVGYSTVLRVGKTWLIISLIVLRGITNSFYQAALPTHLKTISPSAMLIGTVLTIMSISYLSSAPIWGLMIEKKQQLFNASKLIALIGSLMAIVGVSLLGPSPFIPITKTIGTVCVAFSLLGMATSALYIPVFKRCSNLAKKLSGDDASAQISTQIYARIFALVQSASTIGSFFGSTIGGYGTDLVGFPWICALVSFTHIIFIIFEQLCRLLGCF